MSAFNDSRDETKRTRLDIGFYRVKEDWATAKAHFSADKLMIFGHPVMESWEDGYMRELARIATSRGGRVLELGFGMGISASYIQQSPITEHVIIEANDEVAEKAREFARSARYPVTVVQSFWEHATPQLPAESFDGILFDTYPLSADEVHCNHFWFFEEAFRLLKPGGVFTYYSDEIKEFSPQHLALLQKVGFRDISGTVCQVHPPADCQYWKSNTILAPSVHKPQREQPSVRNYGLHITLDAYGANSKKLEDVSLLYNTLDGLPARIGMQKIGFPHIAQFTQADIAGISGIIMIVESHISIHTYSKKDFLSMDVYSCKDFDYQPVIDYIKSVYEFKECELNVIVRGKRFPVHNLHA